MLRVFVSLSILILVSSIPVKAAELPEKWKHLASNVVVWFETSGRDWGTITPDFDCQGMSAGAFQWNIGKGSLWSEVLSKVPSTQFQESMPTYGTEFRSALSKGRAAAMAYVRQFQVIRHPEICKGNRRGASWSSDGSKFAGEVASLMKSPPVRAIQQIAIDRETSAGWNYATWWARGRRGSEAAPTFVELVFFTDTKNFNGIWKNEANPAAVVAFRNGRTNEAVKKEILSYMTSETENQFGVDDSIRNAQLWSSIDASDEQIDLLTFAYLVATNIAKEEAKQFRLMTLSRRGTIIFNDGWVNGERKKFLYP